MQGNPLGGHDASTPVDLRTINVVPGEEYSSQIEIMSDGKLPGRKSVEVWREIVEPKYYGSALMLKRVGLLNQALDSASTCKGKLQYHYLLWMGRG